MQAWPVQSKKGRLQMSVVSQLSDNLMKFVLVSILGAAFAAYLASLRDRTARKEAILSALREMNIKIDDLYRSTKQTKRMIRSRLESSPGRPSDSREYEINAKFFAERMDELSNTQLKLEQVRNAVRTRSDLFDEGQKQRILSEISYTEEYLHDVVEEFEKRKVEQNADMRRITPQSCKMLTDYLDARFRPDAVRQGLEMMDSGTTGIARYEAFTATVNKAREIEPEDWRRKSISDQSMLLAMREIRDAIEERGRRRPQFSAIMWQWVRRKREVGQGG
jgi:hypothetical protein